MTGGGVAMLIAVCAPARRPEPALCRVRCPVRVTLTGVVLCVWTQDWRPTPFRFERADKVDVSKTPPTVPPNQKCHVCNLPQVCPYTMPTRFQPLR